MIHELYVLQLCGGPSLQLLTDGKGEGRGIGDRYRVEEVSRGPVEREGEGGGEGERERVYTWLTWRW